MTAQQERVSPNDRIRIALIGAGGMGTGNVRYATANPGVELAAVCDIYDGRLTRAKEVFGADLFATRDYREILARPDIDAVIIATPDHWHAKISIDALAAGKHVYCEKPMIHSVGEGWPVIEAQRKSDRVYQVGSQYVSSIIYEKAGQLLRAGAIGELNAVESWLDRNTALGAWQYSIPPDASPDNIDWDRFLGSAPKRPFEPIRLFRWRNYDDYGTGVAGDLFVHLLSGLHYATGSLGPNRVFATGGLRFWKDGRDAADVMLALLDYPKTEQYPEFTLSLRVNFCSGLASESFGFRFVGSEGVISTNMSSLTISKRTRDAEPGFTISTFPEKVQQQFLREYRRKYPRSLATAETLAPEKQEQFVPPREHNAHTEHHRAFYAAIRNRKPAFEDAVFGMRAAAPALLCNVSYAEGKACLWDANQMKRVG